MNFSSLHEPFKDEDSPSVEAQIRWLQKQGFAQHQIQKTMVRVYSEISKNEIPRVWTRQIKDNSGRDVEEKIYRPYGVEPKGEEWSWKKVANGWDLCQYILEIAKSFRTKDLTRMIKDMEKFESDMKDKWLKEIRGKVPWYKRMFGIREKHIS